MKHIELLQLIKQISLCEGKNEENNNGSNYPCNKSNGHMPLIMYPNKDAYIMMISESPSVPASNNRALNNSNNPSYIGSILPLIFNNCKENVQLLESEFNNKFYWTHFCKCCPGDTNEKGNLNQICANTYLKKEIELFAPKLIITIGAPASKYLFGLGRSKSMKPLVNKLNKYKITNFGVINTICLTHFSGENRVENKVNLELDATTKLLRRELNAIGVEYIIE